MKLLAIIFICLCTSVLIGQNTIEDELRSSLEAGLSFENYKNHFTPRFSINLYRTESNILHFSPSFRLEEGLNEISAWSISNDFWNEYRKYLGKSSKVFLSHGLTLRTGFSTADSFLDEASRYEWQGASLALGYRLGFGYRIDKHFTFTGTINPRGNLQVLDDDFEFSNSIKLQAPLNFGLNYRF